MSHSYGYGREPDPASVLEVIRGTTRSWEQDPRPYATADEEQLRSILVGSLNGAFLGRATAESFSGRGKVDITVRDGSDNVLLAECKFYNGPNSIRDAADQLLSYSGWRDRDLSLLIFVRSAAITTALAAVQTAVERSSVIERSEPVDARGAEVMLHGFAPDDPDRSISVRCLLVHIKTPRTPRSGRPRHASRASKPMHPDDLADALLDLKRSIPSNQGIDYTPTMDPEAAATKPIRGWDVTWSRTTPDGSVGINAAPQTPEAMADHGPEGALVAPDDHSAREMHLAVRRANRDFVRVKVSGIGIRVDRIAASLRDPADRIARAAPERNTVSYGPRGLWQCSVTVEHPAGKTTVPMAFLPTDQPRAGWDVTVRGTLHDVALTLSMRADDRDTEIGWELQLRRRGWAEERLAALRFLQALRGGGRLLVESIEPDFGNGGFTLEPEEPDAEIEWELGLWTHVVAIQEHLGRELPVPDDPFTAQEWVNGVFAAGQILRTGLARVIPDPGRAHLKPGGVVPKVGDTTSLPMEVPIAVRLADETLELGKGRGLVEVRVTGVDEREAETIMSFEAASPDSVELEVSN
jgi:hypothetical protein